jgi:succinoglycan biosynthesis transport protein ExoP
MSVELQTAPQGLPAVERRMPLPSSGEQVTLMEVWRLLSKQRLIIFVVTILSVAGATWHAFRTKPVFESVGRIEIQPQQTPNIGIQQVIEQSQSGGESTALQTEVRILQSDSVLFQTGQSLNLIDRVRAVATTSKNEKKPALDPKAEISPSERRAVIGFIRGRLKVTVLNGTSLVEIRYQDGDPRYSAAVVNKMVETYSDEDLRSRYERTMHVSGWLQTQLENLQSEAKNAQQQLADYQRAHNIVGTDENSNLTIQTLSQLSSSVDSAEADRIIKEARLHDFDSMSPNLVAVMGDNPSLAALRSQLETLETQQAQLTVKYGPRHPKIIDLETQIKNVQAQIDSEVALARRQIRDEYEGALGAEQSLRKRLGTQEEATYKLNEGAAQYAILRNQAELTRDLYDTLQMRLKEATVMAGLSATKITVVDVAQVPDLPMGPRKSLILGMGLFGGLLGGCVLAFLMESIDDRLQTSDEVESVAMLPSLAAIPHFNSEADRSKRRSGRRTDDGDLAASQLSPQLVAVRDTKSVSAEAYRNLRSALLLSSIDTPPRTIVITSAFPGEGKTTTAINIAIVLAQRGEKVLLVDADLRLGRLARVFGLSGSNIGLSTILAEPSIYQDIPVPLPELPTLCVLPTGPRPPNPAEMLSSVRMGEQLRQWSQEYDRIVLDTSPLLAVSDTQSMAVYADAVVLVTRARMTRKRALLRARDMLVRISAPIAGVVVNDVDQRLENFYTYHYGAYGYRYGYRGYGPYSDRAYGYENEGEELK